MGKKHIRGTYTKKNDYNHWWLSPFYVEIAEKNDRGDRKNVVVAVRKRKKKRRVKFKSNKSKSK